MPLNPLQDHGSPQLSSTSYVAITVVDRDDRNPKFTRSVYRASVKENYPIKVGTLDNRRTCESRRRAKFVLRAQSKRKQTLKALCPSLCG